MHQVVVAEAPRGLAEFRRGWTVVVAAACGAGAGITGAMFYSLGIFLVPLSNAFGWSRTEVSAAKTFLTIGLTLTAPIVGYFADKLGVRRIGLISMMLLGVAMLGMTQITANVLTYYTGLVLMAVLGGGTTALVWTRGVASWFEEKRGLALALTLTGTGVAGIITPPLIGGLIDRFDWRAGFIGMAGLIALALIPIYFFFVENRGSLKPGAAAPPIATGLDVPAAARRRQFWQLGVAFFLVGGIISSLTVHLVPLLTDHGVPRAAAAQVASVLGTAVILGRLLTGYLVDRLHPPFVAGFFLSLPLIGMALLLGSNPGMPLTLVAAVCIGFAAGSEVDMLPYLTARYFGLKAYGKIYGWLFVMFYTGVGIGPVSFGRIFDLNGSYDAALLWSMPGLALGAAAVAALGRPPQMV